jgi:hypothetical protein
MFKIAKSTAAKRPKKASEGLITWKVIETKMPWSLMFLLGGGFAISKGSVASSMARQIGNFLSPLRHLPPTLILAILCFFCGTLTEITSNVGVANITLPVIAQMVSSFSHTQRENEENYRFFIYLFLCLPERCDGDTSVVSHGAGYVIVLVLVSITSWYTAECDRMHRGTHPNQVADYQWLYTLAILLGNANHLVSNVGCLHIQDWRVSRLGKISFKRHRSTLMTSAS